MLHLLLVAAVASGATGNWNGTYNFTVQLPSCANQRYSASGNASITLLQTGDSIAGRLDLTHFLRFTTQCVATTAELTRGIVGHTNGSSIEWTFPNDLTVPRFTGTTSGDAMNVAWTDDMGAVATLSLTRTGGDAPWVDVSGLWHGKYDFTDHCSATQTAPYSGAFTLALTQSGRNAGGIVTMHGVPLYKLDCSKVMSLDATLEAAGTVSGSTFSGNVFEPSGSLGFPITATFSDSGMSGKVDGMSRGHTTGTFTLTSMPAVVATEDVGGSYEGTYSETDDETYNCINVQAVSFGGPASLTVSQAGNDVSGWLTLHDAEAIRSDLNGLCTVLQVGDIVVPVYGAVEKNVLTVNVPNTGGSNLYAFAFSGESVTGNLRDSAGDVATLTATRSSSTGKRRSVRP